MNNAEKYINEQLKDEEFRNVYFEEKLKIDLEFLIDELGEKIKSNQSKTSLIRGLNKIKRTLAHA